MQDLVPRISLLLFLMLQLFFFLFEFDFKAFKRLKGFCVKLGGEVYYCNLLQGGTKKREG